jgi:hypothetical protein
LRSATRPAACILSDFPLVITSEMITMEMGPNNNKAQKNKNKKVG